MSTKKEVATVTSPIAGLPAPLQEALLSDAGQGLEEASREDFAIPFLNVLQLLSPQVDTEGDAYVPDAKAGMLFNNVTGQVYNGETGIVVVPVHFEKVFNEFVPRDAGGGWRGQFVSKEEALENVSPGNEIIDTANHYVLYRAGDDDWQPALLSCVSTKLKVSRQWLAKMRMLKVPTVDGARFTPATFAQMWAITVVRQENQHGKFYNLATEYVGLVDDMDLYETAKLFRDTVRQGTARADFTTVDSTPEGETPAAAGGGEF